MNPSTERSKKSRQKLTDAGLIRKEVWIRASLVEALMEWVAARNAERERETE